MTFDAFCRGKKQEYVPGPGSYDIPSSFLQGPKISMHFRRPPEKPDTNPSFQNLPSTLNKNGVTMSKVPPKKRKAKKYPDTPGPCYNIQSSIGDGPRITIGSRLETKKDNFPGPGSYEIPSTIRHFDAYIGVGDRDSFISNNVIVGPGAYNYTSFTDNIRPTTISERERPHFSRKPPAGPKYNVTHEFGSDAPKFSMPRGPRDRDIPLSPGPGDYEIKDNTNSRKIYTRVKNKPKEREEDVNHMPYYVGPPKMHLKGVSMAHRPATTSRLTAP